MLSDREKAILDFEAQRWNTLGAKEDAIRQHFDVSATRYFQQVNALIDKPEALVYAPVTVKRLRRLRETRRAARRAG